jgi:iron complex outermembrane receptor protein
VAGNTRITSASALAALSISAGALAQTTPPAGSRTEEMDTVVVTGVRQSLTQGLENKREATQVIESIVAEDIGKLPDNNVIEALQRVTGVQITNRGGGEAGGGDQPGIFIRGLSDITTTWNGRNVFTGVGRALALQDIPANLISRVDVFKTRASEQLETGLAGQIDVRTRRPFDLQGLEVSLLGRVTQQEQRDDSMDPNLSFLVANTWDVNGGEAGRFGALFNVSYSRTRWRDQSITAGAMVPFVEASGSIPPGFTPLQRIFNGSPPIWQAGLDRGLPSEPGSTLLFPPVTGAPYPYLLARDALFASDFEGDRKRPAANVSLQWAPNDNQEYTLEVFYQGFREQRFNNLYFTFADWWNALGPNPASTITLYPDSNVIKTRVVGNPFNFNSGDAFDEETDTLVYALTGKWQVGERLTLEADLSFQESQFETNFIAIRTERGHQQITLDFNAGDGIPSWHFTDPATGANVDENLLNPAQWNMGQLFQNAGKDLGGAQTAAVDGDFELGGEGSTFERLSFGVRYDDRDAIHRQPVTTAAPFLPGAPQIPVPFSTMPEGMQWTNEDFYDGTSLIADSWLVVNGYWLQDHADEVRAMYLQPAGGPEVVRSYEVEEHTTSAYVQMDMTFGEKFHAQAGVRYTRVSTPIEFNDLVAPGQPETRAKSEVDDIMPSVTLRYDVTDSFRLRANYGETLRRPAFVDLNPNFTLTADLTGIGYGTGVGGNPDLEAAKGKNLDLTFEWYFAEDSAVYGTWFKRDIDGLVIPTVQTLVIPGTGLNVDTFQVTRPVNASDGKMDGFELGFLYFPQLPGVFNGLGLQGSLTKLDSSQNIPRFDATGNIVGEDTSEFFGVSDMSYNVTLAYDHSGFGGRLSYVWRDDFLNNNEQRLFANPIGIWRQPESSLDLQLNYDFNEHFAISFDVVNITEEEQKSYYAFADAGGPEMFNFGNTFLTRQMALGVRWKY